MADFFTFKQFKIYHDKCAMKVGTDGVLLGAWADCKNATNILDIGTGTGLIAIMLAQRSDAQITAVEIVQEAFEQAIFNVNNTEWKARINVQNIRFQKFANNFNEQKKSLFDLIVSNPPFFSNSLKPPKEKKKLAKHNDSLPFEDLIFGVNKLLSKNGKFAIILPFDAYENFIKLCLSVNLFCNKITFVKPNPKKEPKRVLMEFNKNKKELFTEILTIEIDKRNIYTAEYKEITKDFYLNF